MGPRNDGWAAANWGFEMALSTEDVTPPQRMAAVSIIVIVVGAFLPWASFLGFNVSGISGDGRLTLAMALIGAALFAFGTRLMGLPKVPRRGYLIPSVICAVIVALVALADLSNISAIGIYLTLLAGLTWIAAVVWDWRSSRSAGVTVHVPSSVEEETGPEA